MRLLNLLESKTMKKTLLIFPLLVVCFTTLSAQNNAKSWAKLSTLIGNWKGEGSGKPGEGGGFFSFNFDLDSNILIRKSQSTYQATKNTPSTTHSDLMIIYKDGDGVPSKAMYFDNENHVINYSITFPGATEIVFTSDKIPGVPTFRLIYSVIDSSTLNVKFEISQDGEKFLTYIEGKSYRADLH